MTTGSIPKTKMRLARVNAYFKMKAAEVISDDQSIYLLVQLHEAGEVQYSELSTNDRWLALARLAAAGFCDLGANKAQITESGREFILSILRS